MKFTTTLVAAAAIATCVTALSIEPPKTPTEPGVVGIMNGAPPKSPTEPDFGGALENVAPPETPTESGIVGVTDANLRELSGYLIPVYDHSGGRQKKRKNGMIAPICPEDEPRQNEPREAETAEVEIKAGLMDELQKSGRCYYDRFTLHCDKARDLATAKTGCKWYHFKKCPKP